MQVPLKVTSRNMDTSGALDAEIRKRVDTLSKKHTEIISCRVVVEAPPKHRQAGRIIGH